MSIGLPPVTSPPVGVGGTGVGSASAPAAAALGGAPVDGGGDAAAVTATAATAATAETQSAAPVSQAGQSAPTPAQAVAMAKADAAAKPGGLAPLLADLSQAVQNADLPASIRETASQILSLNLPADQAPTGQDIRQAFATTGPTTESRFAAQGGIQTSSASASSPQVSQPVGQDARGALVAATPSVPQANAQGAMAAAGGDLKSLLLVLHQTLSDFVANQGGDTPTVQGAGGQASATAAPAAPATASPTTASAAAATQPGQYAPPVSQGQTGGNAGGDTGGGPFSGAGQGVPVPPQIDTQSDPQSGVQAGAGALLQSLLGATTGQSSIAQNPAAFSTLALLQAMGFVSTATNTASSTQSTLDTADTAVAADDPAQSDVPQRLPVKGAATSAQSPAKPNLPSATGGDVGQIARHLLNDSDAALAHQKLLQIASLPEPAKPSQSHWMFEIPIATAQGTAVAQFAIDKDGGGQDQAEEQQTVWRARFSVNLEPLGPVHACVALGGEKTFVTLWADRRASLQALKDDAQTLTDALNAAELNAEVAFRPVLTPKPVTIGSGHFLDRLS